MLSCDAQTTDAATKIKRGSCCPMCGRAYAKPGIEVDLASGKARFGAWSISGLGRRQSLLLDGLSRAFPRGLTKGMAIEATYGWDNDHLENVENLIEGHVCALRKKLKGAPFVIKSRRECGYWIEMVQHG